MAKYPDYPASFDAFKKLISEGTVSHKSETFKFGDPVHASTPYITWDHPEADPLADSLEAAYKMYGMPLFGTLTKKGTKVGSGGYWTASEVARHPELKRCSKCNSMRTAQMDPWITLKHCPNCGHVDEMRAMATLPEPTSLGWEDVQKLLVGILRQVPDNKVQVHPAEFNTDGLVFKQETDQATGIVTIWFEKSDLPSPVAKQCSSFTYSRPLTLSATTQLQCNKPSGHPGDHEALDSSWSTVLWPNRAHSVGVLSNCAQAMILDTGGKVTCSHPHGHSGNHLGVDSLSKNTITWSSV